MSLIRLDTIKQYKTKQLYRKWNKSLLKDSDCVVSHFGIYKYMYIIKSSFGVQ
jgi:hypothetical protein